MILDGNLCFTAVPPGDTVATGATTSANIIDLHMTGLPSLASGVGARDMGIGDDPALKLLVEVTSIMSSTGAGTLVVSLQGAPDNGSGLPGSFTTWWQSPTYTSAQLNVQGARLMDMDMPRPPDGVAIPRFLRMVFTGAGSTFQTGQIFAAIVIDRHDQIYQGTANQILGGYPAGVTVAN